MNPEQKALYERLETARRSKVIAYVTGDRPGLETQIHTEVFDFFVEILDNIGVTKKVSLFLYTRGGDTLASWSIINLIRQFCDELEIVIPSKAHSAGTLMCLGANNLVMTKQATLGPIDPSLTTPLNPQIEGGPPKAKVPVSVEAIRGYIELARKELKITNEENFTNILLKLSDKIHPLVLGDVYRVREQIQMLANKLIVNQVTDKEKIKKIISFLCSDSGSHDYTINRREAKNNLGLSIEKPDDALYALIKEIYTNIKEQLELTKKYDPNGMLANSSQAAYSFRRAIVESPSFGSYYFHSEGNLMKKIITVAPGVQQNAIEDQRTYEGWRLEK